MSNLTNLPGVLKPEDVSGLSDVTALIARVGQRVRKTRQKMGISRRILSETSGVSPRYLAQLEAGEGNISIGLLLRVANALEQQIDWLVGDDDPSSSEALQVAQLYRSADAGLQKTVKQMLEAEHVGTKKAGRICLIGLRGAGKSTLGLRIAQALGLPFLELNCEIEAQSGMPVNEVIALYGPEGYRRLEAQAISRVIATQENLVLAAAGGIVGNPETYSNLLTHFHTIWLRAQPEEHMARVRDQGDERPMAGNPEAMDQLRSILTSREVLYDQAQYQVDTSGRQVDESLAELLKLIQDQKILTTPSLIKP